MTDEQVLGLAERLISSFERAVLALEGLNENYRRYLDRLYPERPERREAVVTRVQTEEDRIKEAQGASDEPLAAWVSEVEDEEEGRPYLGVRERIWVDAQKRKEAEERSAGN